MSSVTCSFCSSKFTTFNFYIQHLASNVCGNRKRTLGSLQTEINDKKRKIDTVSVSTGGATIKKTITQTMVPQQQARMPVTQTKNGKARCEFCMKMIKPRGMTQHLNMVHKCSFCDQLVENMETHVNNSHRSEPCRFCNEKFLNSSKVETHIKEAHLRQCQQCEEEFFSEASLNEHTEDVHNSQYCDLCDEKMKIGEDIMDNHKELVHGIKKKVIKEFGGGMMFMMVSE